MRSHKLIGWALLALCMACGDGDEDDSKDSAMTKSSPSSFAQQVTLGQEVYGQSCAGCHGAMGQGTDKAPRVVGLDEGALPLKPPSGRKVRTEDFVTVADVANFVVAKMPPDKPGSLSTDKYLAVLAFDLKANGINLDKKLDLEVAEGLTIPR